MQRERPLQSSMIFPGQINSNTNKRPSNPMQYNFPIPNIKKFSNFASTDHYQGHNVLVQPSRQQQFQGQMNSEQINQNQRTPNNDIIHEIIQKIEKLSKTVDKHQLHLSSLAVQGDISKKVLNQMKKNLPAFQGSNDFHQLFFSLKTDIKLMQEQLSRTPKINEVQAIKKQIQGIYKKGQSSANTSLSNSSANKSTQLDPMLSELLRKRDDFFQNIITNIETEVSILKKNLSNMNLQMKVSPIVSNSCIILKYQQLFKARNKSQSDMILSENTYYIDNEGYLLDFNSRYIVDQKGKKIKLQDKHINMLKSQKILQ